jgi:hypothetical protein
VEQKMSVKKKRRTAFVESIGRHDIFL